MDSDFHFHEWAFLASADPEAFERRRLGLLETVLNESGRHRPALVSLQREIDRQRAAAASPGEAIAAISGMMCASFCTLVGELRELRGELQRLERLSEPVAAAVAAEDKSAASTGAPASRAFA